MNLNLRFVFLVSIAAGILSSARLSGQSFSNHVYEVINSPLTWYEAKADAEARGGHLATITSQAEFEHILSLGILPSGFYWLGATDEASPGTWNWVTGEPWSFTHWAPGEPNSLGTETHLHSLGGSDHRWNNWQGSQVLPSYLLELELPRCTPHKATAHAEVIKGFVVAATIDEPGCGYTNSPAVIIQGGGGSGARARAILAPDGTVASIQILDAGFGYTGTPRIMIGSPPFVPTIQIAVTRISLTQNVVLGWKYVLETSTNAVDWTATGPAFVAESESIVSEFPVDSVGRQFRLRVAP